MGTQVELRHRLVFRDSRTDNEAGEGRLRKRELRASELGYRAWRRYSFK